MYKYFHYGLFQATKMTSLNIELEKGQILSVHAYTNVYMCDSTSLKM